MTTYYCKTEIETIMKLMVSEYLKDCIKCNRISEDFIDLIKYNFLAKYVLFNVEKNSIEIGVEDANMNSSYYPVIKKHLFLLKESGNSWLDNSFRSTSNDLVF
ncbi:hypothetical protein, partial [Gillisia marina]|uniref:hypothetical protein n=1 Tax=Gillisia marina TaxID=1167637 RepID=UPI00029AE80A